jgi:LAO/AO transport system kinase
VQVIKAGILEIGDIFVVNKADREGANRTATELEMMLHMAPDTGGWLPKVYKTVATKGDGITELVDAIFEHKAFLDGRDLRKKKGRERSERAFLALLQETLTARAVERIQRNGSMKELIARIADREVDPYTAVEEVLESIGL